MTENSKKTEKSLPKAFAWTLVSLPLLLLGGGFYFLDGNFHSKRISPAGFTDVLEKGNTKDEGFRRAHAKGVCAVGIWQGSKQMTPYSKADVFNMERPVLGRFALGAGSPFIPDAPAITRSMALRIETPQGMWETGMNDTPVIPMANVQDGYDLFKSQELNPKTHQPDPEAFQQFVKTHPWLKPALAILGRQKPTSSFANDTYYSVSAYVGIDKQGKKHPVRWMMVPHSPVEPASGHENDRNYLFKNLIADIAHKPLSWDMVMVIANSAPEIQNGSAPKDIVDNPSKVWHAHDVHIVAGTVTFTQLRSENGGDCLPISFDPTILPTGLALSGDPIPKLRSQIYMKSFHRRAGETKKPSEITDAMIAEGAKS